MEQKLIRSVVVKDFEYGDENGEIKTKAITVRYFGRTLKQIKERRAEIDAMVKKNPDEIIWLSDTLAERIASLDNLPESMQPFEISVESLDGLDFKNLEAIQKAIEADESPKSMSNSLPVK